MQIILTMRGENNGIQSIFILLGYKFPKFPTELFYSEHETCYQYPSCINMHCPEGFSCPVKTCFTSHLLGDLHDAQWLTLGSLVSCIIQAAYIMIISAKSVWAKQPCFSDWCLALLVDFSIEEYSLNKNQGLWEQLYSISSIHIKFNLVLKR